MPIRTMWSPQSGTAQKRLTSRWENEKENEMSDGYDKYYHVMEHPTLAELKVL